MRVWFVGLLMFCSTAGWGEETPWASMSGGDISTGMTGRALQYENAWQDFRASGRTLYNAGHDSWGYWRIEGDNYCSQWPPSDLWACYKMERRGAMLRFVGEQNDVTEATYRD